MPYDLDRHLMEFRVNGFTVFADLIPHDKIERIQEAWAPIRNADIEAQGEYPPRGWGRYNVRVPFAEPFVDPDIFEHPTLVAFFEAILGPDYAWSHYDSNIPLPGADYQSWHRDGKASPFPGIMTPAFTIGCKFPLCDTSEENGSFQVIPCTQYIPNDYHPQKLDELLGTGADHNANFHPIRLNLTKGSLWMHDGRVFHRGTPNNSNHPRDELCMGFCQSWVHNGWAADGEPHLPRALWDRLSDHARHVLRWQKVKGV